MNVVSGVLDQRKSQIVNLFDTGSTLFGYLNQQRQVIDTLLINTTEVSRQLTGLVKDNQGQIEPMLDRLNHTIHNLNEQSDNLNATVSAFTRNLRSIGEVVSAGPYWSAHLADMPPSNMAPLLPSMVGTGQK
jgi:phospholipid/cholesterol/gamma-HCH transport system substrate-binding protein